MMAAFACMEFVSANALRGTGHDVSLFLTACGSGDPEIAEATVPVSHRHAPREIRTPRRHAHRMGRADRDGRWRGAARGRFSPGRRRPISGDPELWSLCQ